MGERIDQFCESLRVKLTSIDKNMQSLKTKIDSKAQSAEHDARAHLDAVKKRVEQEHAKVTAAQTEIKKWVDERKAATNEKIADWKTKHEKAKLQEGTVTSVAMRFGFRELGKFGVLYRRAFGESPSQTRQRMRSVPTISHHDPPRAPRPGGKRIAGCASAW